MINHFGKKSGAGGSKQKKGLLLASGLITGEALMGILVALPIFLTGNKDWWPSIDGFILMINKTQQIISFNFLGTIAFLGVIVWLYKVVTKK